MGVWSEHTSMCELIHEREAMMCGVELANGCQRVCHVRTLCILLTYSAQNLTHDLFVKLLSPTQPAATYQ
jgi:hypothetical protein